MGSQSGTSGTILICERNGDFRARASRRLKTLGYEIEEVDSPEAALAAIESDTTRSRYFLVFVGIDDLLDDRVVECAHHLTEDIRLPLLFFAGSDERAGVTALGRLPWARLVEIDATDTVLGATIEMSLALHRARLAAAEREERLRTTLSSIGDAVVAADVNGSITGFNPVAARLTGWEEAEALGANLSDVLPLTVDGKPLHRRVNDALGIAEVGVELVSRSGERYRIAMSASPILATDGSRSGVVIVFRDVTEEHAVRDRLEKTVLVAADGMWDWNLATNEVYFDPRYYAMVGYEVDEFPHRLEEFRNRIHPDDVAHVFETAERHLAGESEDFRVEFRFARKNGGWTWIMGRGLIVERDSDDKPSRFVGTHTDISERIEKEQRIASLLDEQRRLVKEVQHRIKNHMYLMMSMLSLQAGSVDSDETRSALQDAAGRFTSMNVLYERLYRSDNSHGLTGREYVEALIPAIVGTYPTPCRVDLETSIADFDVDERTMPTVGMLLNELLTNALKHAFEGRTCGSISVSINVAGASTTLVVRDDGIGLPVGISPQEPRTFGFRMVDALVDQLNGTMVVSSPSATGTSIGVTF